MTTCLVNPREVIQVARSYIGTPFAHQGRKPGKTGELDCVGLIVCDLQSLSYPIQDFRAYGRDADPQELLRQLNMFFVLKSNKAVQIANVLVFWLTHRTIPQHVAFATGEGTMIHAYGGEAVREERIQNPYSVAMNWEKHLHSVFCLK
jgi:cell wall-associated NlpC family hydrolase